MSVNLTLPTRSTKWNNHANSVEPDETAPNEPSLQVVHWLLLGSRFLIDIPFYHEKKKYENTPDQIYWTFHHQKKKKMKIFR